jgi:hypothetical protein
MLFVAVVRCDVGGPSGHVSDDLEIVDKRYSAAGCAGGQPWPRGEVMLIHVEFAGAEAVGTRGSVESRASDPR